MINKQSLKGKADTYEIKLGGKCLDLLQKYAETLVEWNKKINLTAITQPSEIEDKHFIDSLIFACQPEVAGKIVDVGSGAGFPGIVSKIYRPELDVVLMEPTGKRINFQKEVAQKLGIEITSIKERGEEAARKEWREIFDIATARAVAGLPALCEYCLPLVKTGGFFIAMKGGDIQQEVNSAKVAMQKLGGEYIETRAFTLPDGSARSLIIIRKVAATPKTYPRNGGTIAKKPL